MNLTVTALQNIYTELGGDLTDTYENIAGGIEVGNYTIIPDMLNAIAQIGGSTVELPAVSSSDNGDVLEVVDGKWAKAEPTKELPATEAADSGMILAVNDSGEWDKADAPTEIKKLSRSNRITTTTATSILFSWGSTIEDAGNIIGIGISDGDTKTLLNGLILDISNNIGIYSGHVTRGITLTTTGQETLPQGLYKIDVYYI